MSNQVLIHGAWGGAWEFREIVRSLEERGHPASAVDLPGHGQNQAPIPEVTMDAYVECVIEAVKAIDSPIVLVGHSLAGSVISQVAEAIPRKIERLVYISAFLPENGETPLGLLQSDEASELLSKIVFSEDQSYATVGEDDIKTIFLHDVRDKERVDEYAHRLAIQQATEPFMAPAKLTKSAFGSVPKLYVRSSLDKVMSPSLQERMVSSWQVERVFTLESGHFPLMSVPEQLVEILSEAAGASAGTS